MRQLDNNGEYDIDKDIDIERVGECEADGPYYTHSAMPLRRKQKVVRKGKKGTKNKHAPIFQSNT